jgi:dTDP-N-acetylfucosamine:lipid II N-acetylfucosaminyltransferase
MNYHIMSDAVFIDWFIEAAESISPDKNIYLINTKSKNSVIKSDKIIIAPVGSKIFKGFTDKIVDGDKVFAHWVSPKVQWTMNRINKNVKIGLFFWGGDFYEQPDNKYNDFLYDVLTKPLQRKYYNLTKNPLNADSFLDFSKKILAFLTNSLKNKIFEYERKTFLSRLDYFAGLIPEELDWVKARYDVPKAQFHYFFYGNKTVYGLDTAGGNDVIENNQTDKCLNILIGNSANETNNHLDVFKALEPFIKGNFKLILPLNYGFNEGKHRYWYRNEVIKQAKTLFGESKVLALTDMVPFAEYKSIMNAVDIAFMNHNRQQAVGNIIALLAQGKKVYMKTDKNILAQFLQQSGASINAIENVSSLQYADFSKPLSIIEKKQNLEALKSLFNEEKKYLTLANLLK